MFDWKITNGQIIDGLGNPPRLADIAGVGGVITAMGDLSKAAAQHTYDLAGNYVCPGFIDAHSHSDAYILIEPTAPSKLYQGVTTEIIGNCGASAAPIRDRNFLSPDWAQCQFPGAWRTFEEYLELLAQVRPILNIAPLIGHGKLRQWVMGNAPRAASRTEIRAMCDLMESCLKTGARGMSTGLIYAPSRFAENIEIHELALVLAKYDAVYTTHMRSEAAGLLESLDENINLARATGVRLQISHLKTSGKEHWHMLDAALDKLRRARAQGLKITVDRYPYTAGHTDLDVIFPVWAAGGGREAVLARLRNPNDRARLLAELRAERPDSDWGHITVAATSEPQHRGRPLTEIAETLDVDPPEAALQLIEADQLQTSAFFAGMSDENMWRIYAEPYAMVGSDSALRAPTGPLGANHYHPRAYGTFPKFIKAALAGQTVALPEAIRKITSLPADQFQLKDRGQLSPNFAADITAFDPHTLDAPADYLNPHQFARGITLVMVNGKIALNNGAITEQRPGQALLMHNAL